MPTVIDMNLEAGAVEWLPERRFREEDRKLLWFHDIQHNNPPISPMGASLFYWPRSAHWAAEHLSFPTSKGFDFRLYYGRVYPAPLPITDPEEVAARAPVFEAKCRDLVVNWPERYAGFVREWVSLLGYLKGIKREVVPLPKLLELLKDTVKAFVRVYDGHFECMYALYVAYMHFEDICRKHGINERDMRIFLQGFDTKMYEVDRGLWRLAALAKEMGLEETFRSSNTPEELKAALEQSEKGRVWLDQLQDFLDAYGRRTTAAMFDIYYKTWIEDPYPVLSTIKTYILRGAFDFEEHTRKLIEERDRFIAEVLERIPAGDKDEFVEALKEAQTTYPFNEDHNFYVEQWGYAELRYSVLECGNRLANYGILSDPEDVFFLTVEELQTALEAIIMDQHVGVREGKLRLPVMVKERKERWQELHKITPPPFIGTIPDTRVDDPIFIKVWGNTDEVIRGQAKPADSSADRVEGFPGAPGVAEGIARVIFGYEGFSEVMPDDILIAPFTTPAWTPLFSKIKAVATDSGGMLAHAAISAREYNVPAVVGTITRGKRVSEVVKTGQRVRVDGTNGVVEVLSS